MKSKPCRKCGIIKPLTDFYALAGCKDGHRNTCNRCVCDLRKAWVARNHERHNQNQKKWVTKNKAKMQKYAAQYYHVFKNNRPYNMKNRQRIHGQIKKHVYNGTLIKFPCSICLDKKSLAHHYDYRKPLDVIWLCKRHHQQLHTDSLLRLNSHLIAV